MTSGGSDIAIATGGGGGATVGAVLTVTLGTAALPASAVAVLTCTDNLAANGAAAGPITFSIRTASDTAELTSQTGYTIKSECHSFTQAFLLHLYPHSGVCLQPRLDGAAHQGRRSLVALRAGIWSSPLHQRPLLPPGAR